MIIDAHMHLVGSGWVRGKYVVNSARVFATRYNRVHGTNLTPDQFLEQVIQKYVDPDADNLVKTMNECGVDTAVIFNIDLVKVTGEARVTNYEVNRHFAEVAKRHPGRFWPLCAIDPRREDAVKQATEAIEQWGMKGIKLMPATGFYPTDPVCFPLYQKCREWNVPIMFHSGGWEMSWECSQPLYIASVAEQFPEVKMIIAHAGLESWQQAMQAASVLPNVYLDLSLGGQWEYWLHPNEYYRWLRNLVDETGPWKVMWGTDWPGPNTITPIDQWIKAIKEPQTEILFSQEEREIILGRAAQKVFNIPDDFNKSIK